jgi:hypothetical protein
MQQERCYYSITSSASASSLSGTVRPSALAVLRLITKSNFVGCMIGKSPFQQHPWAGAAKAKTENG